MGIETEMERIVGEGEEREKDKSGRRREKRTLDGYQDRGMKRKRNQEGEEK